MSEEEKTKKIEPVQSVTENLELTKSSNFIGELANLVNYGAITRVFSIVIKQNRPGYSVLQSSYEKELRPIEINKDFIKKWAATALLPQNNERTKWGKEVFDSYDLKDQDLLKETFLNFDSREVGFDDILYRIFTRKVQHISLEEGKTLYFAKLKTIKGLSLLKTPQTRPEMIARKTPS